jgi:hypothetical protein
MRDKSENHVFFNMRRKKGQNPSIQFFINGSYNWSNNKFEQKLFWPLKTCLKKLKVKNTVKGMKLILCSSRFIALLRCLENYLVIKISLILKLIREGKYPFPS